MTLRPVPCSDSKCFFSSTRPLSSLSNLRRRELIYRTRQFAILQYFIKKQCENRMISHEVLSIETRKSLTEIKILLSGSLAVRGRSIDRIQRFLLHLRYCVAVKDLDRHVLRVRIHSANKHGLLGYRDVNRLKL